MSNTLWPALFLALNSQPAPALPGDSYILLQETFCSSPASTNAIFDTLTKKGFVEAQKVYMTLDDCHRAKLMIPSYFKNEVRNGFFFGPDKKARKVMVLSVDLLPSCPEVKKSHTSQNKHARSQKMKSQVCPKKPAYVFRIEHFGPNDV